MTATSLVTARSPFEAGERFLHVVQDAQVEHDIELPEFLHVDSLKVGHHGLHLRVERGHGEFEAAPPPVVPDARIGLVA